MKTKQTCINLFMKSRNSVILQIKRYSWYFMYKWYDGLIIESETCSTVNVLEKDRESHVLKKIFKKLNTTSFDFEREPT